LTLNSDGSFQYTPNGQFVGSDSFDFEVSNGVDTDSATVTIDVQNSTPQAYGSSASVLHDQTLSSYVSGYDMDGDAVSFSIASPPANGSLSLNSDGSYTYTPNTGFDVSDGLASDSGTFTINVYNTAPQAFDGSDSVLHDQILYSSVSGSDLDGNSLSFTVSVGPSSGTLNLSSDGSFDYTPNAGFIGNDSFDFDVSDGVVSDTATFTINVYNSPPDAYDGSDSVIHDQQLNSNVSGSDVDGDAITFSVLSGPSNGTLNLNADGSFIYTPNAGFVGMDIFGFDVSDGIATDSATFTINVYNSAPEAYDVSESVVHDQQLYSSVFAQAYADNSLWFAGNISRLYKDGPNVANHDCIWAGYRPFYFQTAERPQAYALFDKTKSWAKDSEKSDALLNHEQRHFDIAHVFAEGLDKELAAIQVAGVEVTAKNAHALSSQLFNQAVKELYTAYKSGAEAAQKQYDTDTNHSLIQAQQDIWNAALDAGKLKKEGGKIVLDLSPAP
jgi:hypothetical protein